MSKSAKIWLVTAALLILIGCVIFVGVMAVLKWDFSKLSTVKFETNNYVVEEDYKNISIVTDTADIVFVTSENEKGSVTCYESKNQKHSVAVKGDTLVINLADTRKWYEYIGITFGTPKITVCIPDGEFGSLSIKSSTGNTEIPKDFKFESVNVSGSTGDVNCYASASKLLKIKLSTGSINVNEVNAGELDLAVSTGKVSVNSVNCEGDINIKVSTGKANLSDIACKSLTSSGSTGDLTLKNVIATEIFSVERSTGNIKLQDCDAAELFIKTDTGDVTGSLLTDKVFIAGSDTGKIKVPKTVNGGRCEITTDTGDIKITVK